MHDLFIKNGKVLDLKKKKWFEGGLVIEEGVILKVGKANEIRSFKAGHDIIDASNSLIIPGLINSHTHLPETLLRGICDDKELKDWLWEEVWPREAKMGRREAYAGALLGCLELIKNGCTSFIDQFYYADEIAKACKETRIRALICPSIFDRCPESGRIDNAMKKAISFVRRWKNPHLSAGLLVGFGPHAP
ncbi:MAG: amidohydrolase family protein, partial [Candidatus Thermoplasmatota archaeon]